jgi:hypothetical protein
MHSLHWPDNLCAATDARSRVIVGAAFTSPTPSSAFPLVQTELAVRTSAGYVLDSSLLAVSQAPASPMAARPTTCVTAESRRDLACAVDDLPLGSTPYLVSEASCEGIPACVPRDVVDTVTSLPGTQTAPRRNAE